MKKFLLAFMLIFSSIFICNIQAAPVEVKVKVRDNPTLYFPGIQGNAELSNSLRAFLGACGWFDLTGDPKADYNLTGSLSGNTLTLTLNMLNVPVNSWRITVNGSARDAAKVAVDTIIEKTFNELKIKGFCQTKIAFCAETSKGIKDIYICDIDGNNITQVTNFNTLCVEPCWFPDGKTIGFSKYNRTGIDVVAARLADKKFKRLVSLPGINAGAAISPNGQRLAAILSPDHMVDLYVMNSDGEGRRRLTKNNAVEASPCWSPDSREIAFVSDETGRPQIYTIAADGSSRKRIPGVGVESVTPDWSSDNKIVYSTKVDGAYTLAVYDVKTGENKRITEAPGSWESPAWAADNRQIVAKSTNGNKSALFVVDSWTGKTRLLVSTPSNLSMPVWSQGRQ